jgi:hypothetical protein
MKRELKITLGEMRDSGSTPLIVYCAHRVVVDANRWGDNVRLSDLEPRFTCQACGHRGASLSVGLVGLHAFSLLTEMTSTVLAPELGLLKVVFER